MRKPVMWLAAVGILLLVSSPSIASFDYVLEPGTHELTVAGQSFEVTNEVRIELVFTFIDEYRVAGTVTVVDSIGYGWVRLFWVEQNAVILEDTIQDSLHFDYNSSETGHAERKQVPRFGPTMVLKPSGR